MTAAERDAWVEVDLDAIRHNTAALVAEFAPSELCAVVKADGYGHGAVRAAEAALAGGATRLAVALVEEGRELRDAGIRAPILLLSQPPSAAMSDVVALGLTPTLYTPAGVAAAADAVDRAGAGPLAVHVKVDTGMNRVGATPDGVIEILTAVSVREELVAEGLFTHFAVADEPENDFTMEQAETFGDVIRAAESAGLLPPLLHCSNSAAGLLYPGLRQSFVRAGIALYGIPPSEAVPLLPEMRPAMKVRSGVSFVKRVPAGGRISYGGRYTLDEERTVATVPVGYADGLPRPLSDHGGQALVGGLRRPLAGSITMDQCMVDMGNDVAEVGDDVVFLGRQGSEEITANEIAERLGTVGYEVVCRIGPRLPRRYTGVADIREIAGQRAPLRG